MKFFFVFSFLFFSAVLSYGQEFTYADTIVTPLGNFMLETNEEITDMSFNQQTQLAEDGGHSEQLNFYPSGERHTSFITSENVSFNINPNPTHDQASLSLKNGGSDLTVNILDISGRIISTQTFYSVDGTYSRPLDLSECSAGIYFIVIKTGGAQFLHKLVKQ